MKAFTSLPEFRYALLLALATLGWMLLDSQWQAEQAERTRHSCKGEATFLIVIPAYILFVATGFGALAYLSHAWQRWRNPAHPPAGRTTFVLLFFSGVLTYLVVGLSWLAKWL
ncbi:hypothetical protein DNI29_16960 [Hymenobacter sediminis]|uniref:hypothetical protein n=1 Tax=Hymenobacter sediminis TaxID=2218621 RepID=UPI000DA658A5|nr:hypothetical protein [Hymenobacter sediminis]RPD45839.1 hypothetical protein DNI29_16960 [Hymenobacter sediminis]